MRDWKRALLPPTASIREAVQTIQSSELLIAIIADEHMRLLGLITDADIRTCILRGISLESPVTSIMTREPRTVGPHHTHQELLQVFEKTGIRHLPIVDDNYQLLGMRRLDEIHQTITRDNWVVIMAGGLGSRLGSLTKDTPKPLLKVGNKPILETILQSFIEQGFKKFFVSVNYKAEMIECYFGAGERWGVDIQYLKEDARLGTAGALSLISEEPTSPVIVMNGDVLTKVSFQALLDFHNEHRADATMCVREYDFQVPYGVVKLQDKHITKFDEKPIQKFFVNAGIYVLSPFALEHIPKCQFYDMPSLFESLAQQQHSTVAFPIREYWIDVGQTNDFKKANGDYKEVFQ